MKITRVFLPASSQAWAELPVAAGDDPMTWTSGPVLSLTPGGRYLVQVGAVNGAGLTAVRKTNGVIVDITPPQVQSGFYLAWRARTSLK